MGAFGTPAEARSGAHANGWRMLHPLGLLVALVQSIRAIISTFISLLVVFRLLMEGRFPSWVTWAIIVAGVGLTIVEPIIRWASTRYRLGVDSLQFRSGLFFRKNRTIGYGSIHAISSSSPVYMQPFGIVQLTVSAAGATDTDITLDAVPAALQLELERLRAQARTGEATTAETTPTAVTQGSPSIAAAVPSASSLATPSPPQSSPVLSSDARPESNAPVFRASVRDITLFAVTDLGFIAAAFVVFGFVQNLQDMLPRDWVRTAERSVGDYVARGVISIVMLVLVCVIVLMVVSVVTSLLRFYGFEVWRRGDDLVVVRGLFTRRTTTIPVSRIQSIVVRQSLLRRPFHLCSVGLGLSSSVSGESEESGISAARILPVIGTGRVYDVLTAMLPEWDPREPGDATEPIHRTGRGLLRYYVTTPIVVALVAAAAVGTGVMVTISGAPSRWLFIVPLAIGAYWTVCRALKSRTEGYAILPDRPNAFCSSDSSDPSEPLPHRILVTGAKGLTTFAMTTRRSRVQSITRSTTPWREPRGIEKAEMPLFVMNGISALRFTFLHRSDAETLDAWLTRPAAR
ncbi:hypothetical protein BW13_02845 [Bifidobacterium sp. UTCIF-37]|uniref:PH domain-containing protein n=1 Tax=unclassified Bifidobacterium TaxID=2608897 RepID=UPI00112775B6|nr:MULTISPECIES: PH domain-containing protein [unclassified Bifidobacterium]TPF86906.1 hypothetical protein BW13_02845 [Bifidobacterium sp. UTCIF-37]TPF90668.1 hypothetical protein BW11_02245 [Bifidobacterium sp. UTCIF-38]